MQDSLAGSSLMVFENPMNTLSLDWVYLMKEGGSPISNEFTNDAMDFSMNGISLANFIGIAPIQSRRGGAWYVLGGFDLRHLWRLDSSRRSR